MRSLLIILLAGFAGCGPSEVTTIGPYRVHRHFSSCADSVFHVVKEIADNSDETYYSKTYLAPHTEATWFTPARNWKPAELSYEGYYRYPSGVYGNDTCYVLTF